MVSQLFNKKMTESKEYTENRIKILQNRMEAMKICEQKWNELKLCFDMTGTSHLSACMRYVFMLWAYDKGCTQNFISGLVFEKESKSGNVSIAINRARRYKVNGDPLFVHCENKLITSLNK